MLRTVRYSLTIALLLVTPAMDPILSDAIASPPVGGEHLEQAVGSPIALRVTPPQVSLVGVRASRQLLVTGDYADGSSRDLTPFCQWVVSDPSTLEVSSHGLVSGRADGAASITVTVGEREVVVPAEVRDAARVEPIRFRRDVVPALSVAGCSDIRCHGAPSGKAGFRLSLWGSDADLDFQQLTRDAFGRRTNPFAPEESLILLKATAQISHVGGQRFTADSRLAAVLRAWQAEGLRDEPETVPLERLEVTPSQRVLRAPARWQQLAVEAVFADGHREDVTALTTFSTTDLAVAEVDRDGRVAFKGKGEIAILCRYLGKMAAVRLMYIPQPADDFVLSRPPVNNDIDRHVFAKLKLMNINPSELCSDQVFVRRVFLDLCGILPTPAETREFVESSAVDKRARLVEQLLQRPEYADLWTKRWLDVLRVSRDSIQLAGATAYRDWLREKIANDESLAEIAVAMLTATGESFTDAAVNYYAVPRDPQEVTDPMWLQKDLAEATSQLFLGIRLQCAQCHNHPYERWTQHDYLALAACFTQVKRSRLGKAGPSGRPDRRQMKVEWIADAPELTVPDGEAAVAPGFFGHAAIGASEDDVEVADRRALLADWLTGRENPYFAKAIVNRIWFHLHGRGIVEPVDDFRDSNPAANDPLLDALAAEFVANGFRIKPLIRRIANSRTYQLSAEINASNQGDVRYFSRHIPRPLTAEVLLDAICEVAGVPERFEVMQDYISGIPTESVKYPVGTRAVQLPVNDIATLINTSGKYVRYELHPFLRTFGQPNGSQTCECDRSSVFGRKQALELIVGSMVTEKLSEPDNRLGAMLAAPLADAEMLDEIYLRAYSRRPSPAAAKALLKYVADHNDRREAWEDVVWTVLNSREFVFQH